VAEERSATIIGGPEAALKAIHDELAAFRLDAHGRLARLESGFDQMDKRQSNVEAGISDLRKEIGELRKDNKQAFFWLLGIVLGTWMSTMWAILSKIR